MAEEDETTEQHPFFLRDVESYPDTDVGADVLLLLTNVESWVVRRIEKIEFVDDRSVRRQVSVDFTVPLEPPMVQSNAERAYLIPLGLLRKAPLMGFDLRDESGTALPVLSRRENTLVAWSTVNAMAEIVLESDVPAHVSEWIRKVVGVDGDRTERLPTFEGGEHPAVQELMDDEVFRELLEDLAANFLLLTPVAFDKGRRRILKFSYIERIGLETFTVGQRMGIDPAPIRFALPVVDEAESFHLEIEAPRGMDVYEAELVELNEGAEEEGDTLAYEGERAQRVHLYPLYVRPGATAEARVWLLPITRGLIRSALFFSMGVLGMLLALFFRFPNDAERSAPTLLLALPGVVSLFLIRPGENPMTSRLLLGLRAVVSFAGFLPFAGALLLVMELNQDLERWLWGGITSAALVATIVIAAAYSSSRRR